MKLSPPSRSGQMIVELGCWTAGIALIVIYLAAVAGLENQRERGLELFAQARAAEAFEQRRDQDAVLARNRSVPTESPGTATTELQNTSNGPFLPIAVLRLASVDLEVPVYSDISELNLSRGAGWIDGTAAPNTGGNTALAAHRDRHFRPLKDIQIGDILELESHAGSREFVVSRIVIVDPNEVSVLDHTLTPTVTLVTCYPFYFIGNAPQRYVVQATAVERSGNVSASSARFTAQPTGDTP